MGISRREFLKRTATIAGTTLLGSSAIAHAYEKGGPSIFSTGNTANRKNWKIWVERKEARVPPPEEPYTVLVDTTKCIGCRRCEWACNEWNKNPNRPIKEFEASVHQEKSVFDKVRRTHAGEFTVVNRYISSKDGKPIYVKKQCMHCEEPGCLSSCFVDSFKKTPEGSVLHNPAVCIGCRYCMIACPFDIPAYEYYEALNPQVTKCTMCYDRITEGGVPACVEICTAEALRFGKMSELINLAHERIRNNPGKYVDHVYGEHEVGGTSWLYLSSVPFDEIGLRTDIGKTPIPKTSKGFLFAVKMFEIVGAWPLVFGAYYAISKARKKVKASHETSVQKGEGHGEKH
ncbi:MAG: 4Fe-4S dicluster domain-containing protein [Thermodesulfovibrionales bacterium]|nr:4Fe-4S dicluster domain-containing protein [Thermodesulfovibrionales bacterium]